MRFARLFAAAAVAAGLCSLVRADVDLYPLPQIEDGQTAKPKEPPPVDPFVRAMSERMKVSEDILADATAKGFGRAELLRLILISQKSGRPLKELIQERDKGARLAKIAQESNCDNWSVRREALAILKELEAREKNRPTAGLDGTLARDSTGQATAGTDGGTHGKR